MRRFAPRLVPVGRRSLVIVSGRLLGIIADVKIYTRTGDAGETALFDGSRVSKSDPRVDAYGHIDELNAMLGQARAAGVDPALDAWLDRLQRDLFALGANLADPASKIAARVTKAVLGPEDTARWRPGSTRPRRSCPPFGGSSYRQASPPAPRSTWRAPSAAGPSATSSRWAKRGGCRAARLRQPALRPAVRPGAPGQRAGWCAGPGVVVTLDAAYAACARLARTHYENFPVASHLLPAACGLTSRRCTRLRGSPTISPMRAMRRSTCATRGSTSGWPVWTPPSTAADCPAQPCSKQHGGDRARRFHGTRRNRARLRAAARALRGSRQRVSPGHHRGALRHVARSARLLPAVGQPGRAPRAAHRRAGGTTALDGVRCGVLRTAAHQLLAGPGGRLDARPVYVPREDASGRGGDEQDLDTAELTPAWRDALSACAAADARPVRARARGVRRGPRTAALGTAPHLARRHAHPRAPGGMATTSSLAPGARRLGRAAAAAGAPWTWLGMSRATTSFYYSFLVLPETAARGDRRGLGLLPRR